MTAEVIKEINRQFWIEGVYARKDDLDNIKRYRDDNGDYKNDFDTKQFLAWVKSIEENMAICDMENKDIGKGVFVPPGKIIPKGTFIPSSGIIKLDPTEQELATKTHCSALQDLNNHAKKIYGFIDPAEKGGILDLINHGPDKNEIANFNFHTPSLKARVAISNLRSTIKFYNGYAIMGLEAVESIEGGEYGQQLLWSYARTDEYLERNRSKLDYCGFFLFDNLAGKTGKIIDPSYYALRKINIFIDNGKSAIEKIVSLTRWELIESLSDPEPLILMDLLSNNQYKSKELLVDKHLLYTHLQKNPTADCIILDIK